MKFLLMLVVVGVGVWMLMSKLRGVAQPPRPAAPQAMVECAHCGLHLPAADAVLEGSRVYCSEDHRQRGPRPSAPS